MTTLKRLLSLLALLAPLALTGCGGGGGSAGATPGTGSGGGSGGGVTPGTPGSSAGSATLSVTLSSTDVTAAAPATVTATLRDAKGDPIANRVVELATARGNLATLAVASALTNASGVATTSLRSAGAGVEGADEVIASAVPAAGATAVQGSAGFTVRADAPTLSMTPSSATLRFSGAPAVVTARVLNAAGAPVANQLVTFATVNGLAGVSVGSVLTNAAGDAAVSLRPGNASNAGVEVLTASTTLAGRDLVGRSTVQVIGEAPAVAVASLSSSSVSATAPATLRVAVRDLQGNLLPGAVVTFSSSAGLAAFTPASQVTDANGEASTVVGPSSAGSNGADTVTASVTVQGVAATAQRVLQFVSSGPTGTPTLDLALSSTSISSAGPATVTATLRDAQGNGVPGQVVSFSVARGLASTNVATTLTQSDGANRGRAVVVLGPTSAASAGADDVTASVTFAGVTLSRSLGFQVQATPVTLVSLLSGTGAAALSAYGQTTLTLSLTGAGVTSPVGITVSSSCVSQGKATLSPAAFTATGGTVTMQYRDNGCGAVQGSDQLQAVVTATGASTALTLPIAAPADSSIAFVTAAPEQIFLRGSGFTETSVVTFEVRDAAGNPLPNRLVELRLQTGAGGVTMEGRGVESVNPPSPSPFTLTSNAQGRVSVRVNAGTTPTPVRVSARLAANTAIATVSSNLSVAVGLPSQLNFSLSQTARNIEGYNLDGTSNTYQIIAADRSGNPVPAGTSINFVTEGGQVEAIKQTQIVNGIARTTANFVSSEPRPVDGRVTVVAYALGEESFLDQNGNNVFDAGEPFQDLGNVFKDRLFDGSYELAIDEFVPLEINNASACVASGEALLALNAGIPTMPGTCDGRWSGAGQVYVRRAVETVFSTSASRALWPLGGDARLQGSGVSLPLQIGPAAGSALSFRVVAGDTLCANAGTGTFRVVVADANPIRLNPMAAGTTISASSGTNGLSARLIAGSPVPSSTEATEAVVGFDFTDAAVGAGVVSISFTSPTSGTTSAASVRVQRTCP